MTAHDRFDLPRPPARVASTPWHLRVGVGLLAALAACGGGGGGSDASPGAGPGPDDARNVLFQRRNTAGGADLFRAPIDGSAAPVAVTDNGSKTIDEVLRSGQLVNNRVVYMGKSSTNSTDANFYSVTTDANATPIQLTTFPANTDIDAFETVGNSLVVLAGPFTAQTRDLWVVPVDGSRAARNLTNLGALDQAIWDADRADELGSRILYEVRRITTSTRESYVFDTATDVAPVRLGPTSDRLVPLSGADRREVAKGLADRYLVEGDSLFVRADRNFGAQFQLFEADMATGTLTAMSSTFQTSLLPSAGTAVVDSGFVVAGNFCYAVRNNATPVSNLFAVDFGAATPTIRNVTNFAPGTANTLTWKSFLPAQPKAVIASAATGSGGNVRTDLFVVDVAAGTSTRILDGSIAAPTQPTTDIGTLLVVGGFAIFERNRTTGSVWSTRLDASTPAGDELLANIVGSKGLDGFVIANTGSIQLAAGTIDLRASVIENAFAFATTTNGAELFSDFFKLSASATAVDVRRLSAQTTFPTDPILGRPGIVLRIGDRIVYIRSFGGFFSTPISGSGAELRLNDNVGTSLLSPTRLVYVGNDGNLLTAPYDKDISAGQIRALTALAGGEAVAPNSIRSTSTRVVFAIRTGNSTGRIVSSGYTPNSPSPTDISRATDTLDALLTLF